MSEEEPSSAPSAPLAGTHGEVLSLAYPVALSMLAHTVMGLVDTLFMGWVSTDAQAGVGLGATVVWAFACFFTGTISVVNTFVAQHYGAGRRDRCGEAAWHGLVVAALGSLALAGAAPLVARLIQLFGAPDEVTRIASGYAYIRVVGASVICVEMALTSFMRGIGDTRTPMKVAIGAMLLNLPLNYWLVFGSPDLGPNGAAYATVASGACGVVVLFALFLRRRWRDELGTGFPSRLRARELAALLRVGLPIGVQWVLEMITWTAFTALVSRFGAAALAANNIVLQVLHLSFMPGVGISVAATTLVGQSLGARQQDAAWRSALASLRLAVAFMALMGILFWLGGGAIARLFSRDPRVVELAAQLFMLAACFQVFDAMGMVSGGILRGAGITRFPMLVSLGGAAVVLVPLAWFFALRLEGGVVGAWLAATVELICVGLILALRVRARGWLAAELVTEAPEDLAGEPASTEPELDARGATPPA